MRPQHGGRRYNLPEKIMRSNSFIAWLLRSRLHGLVSSSFMLVEYRENKTGELVTIPVNYIVDGDSLLVVSLRERDWWRSLRQGAARLRLRGRELRSRAQVISGDQKVAEALCQVVRRSPSYRRHLKINLDQQGNPDLAEALQAARTRVVVRFTPESGGLP